MHYLCSKLQDFLTTYPPLSADVICEAPSSYAVTNLKVSCLMTAWQISFEFLRADKEPDFVLWFQNEMKYFAKASEIVSTQCVARETFDLNVVPGAQF